MTQDEARAVRIFFRSQIDEQPASRFSLPDRAARLATSGLAFAQKPGVMIYATGGAIAGSAKSATDTTGYTAGALGIDILLNAVPEIKNVADVSGEQISNVASGDINQAILLKMAKSINAKLGERRHQWRGRHARHRHARGNRLLPRPYGQEQEAGGGGRRHAPGHGDQRRRPDEPA